MHEKMLHGFGGGKNIMIVPDDTDLIVLFGKMQEVFRTFRVWKQKLYTSCSFGGSLQELLNISEYMTENCIYIADMSFKILAYTEKEMMLETSATWRYQMAHGYLPVHVMKGMIETGEFDVLNGFRFAETFYSKNFYTPFATRNIFYNNRPQAHLFVVNIMKRPCYRDLAIAENLALFIEQHYFIMEQYDLHRVASNYEAFFNSVLNDTCTEEEIIAKQLSLFGWNVQDSYCLAVLNTENRGDGFCRTFMYQVESESNLMTFMSGGYLIILQGHTDEDKRADLTRHLKKLASHYHVSICVGRIFSSFYELKQQFTQVVKIIQLAAKAGEKREIYEYSDYAFAYLLDFIRGSDELKQFCSDDAFKLKNADKQNKTEYFSTYLTYLTCDRNIVQTARQLHIHRNTLMYRLEKIHQLIQMNEENVEERLFLLLSMQLIK